MAPTLTIDEIKESLECLMDELSEKAIDEHNAYGFAIERNLKEEAYYASMRGYAYVVAIKLIQNHLTQLTSEYERNRSDNQRSLGQSLGSDATLAGACLKRNSGYE